MATQHTQTGNRAVRAIFQDAKHAIEESSYAQFADPNEPRLGYKPGQWPGAPYANMPPDCPVSVLGFDNDGEGVWILTASGQLVCESKWTAMTLAGLYAPFVDYLLWAWPAFSKAKKVTNDDGSEVMRPAVVERVEVQRAAMCHIREAGTRPTFSPADKHRGRGGWVDDNGAFLWHSGKWLWQVKNGRIERAKPAMVGKYLYTNQSTTIVPWQEAVGVEESPARRILGYLKSWNWERPYLDPLLVLGFIATALMGGALKTRPIIFTTGGAGVGKSTLQSLIRQVLDQAVFCAADTTAAGVYQRAKKDSLPFMIDELEAKVGSTKEQAVIQIARVAYSGDDISRGGADHEGTTFKMFNSFFFSAILPPPLMTQDKTRMAILNLQKLDHAGRGVGEMVLLETDGRMILRQVMDGFTEFNELKQDYFETLAKQGFDSRAIDTYGTLLAAAQMLVGAEMVEDIGLPIDDQARLGEIIAQATALERAEQKEPWLQCLEFLLSCALPNYTAGERMTIGYLLENLGRGGDGTWDLNEARRKLNTVGLSLQQSPVEPGDYWLAIPPQGEALLELFRKSDWYGGNWVTALKQGPKDVILRNLPDQRCKVKINRTTLTCVLVSLNALDRFYEKTGRTNDEESNS